MDVVDKYSISPSVNYPLTTEGQEGQDNQEEKEATRAHREEKEKIHEEISRPAKKERNQHVLNIRIIAFLFVCLKI